MSDAHVKKTLATMSRRMRRDLLLVCHGRGDELSKDRSRPLHHRGLIKEHEDTDWALTDLGADVVDAE